MDPRKTNRQIPTLPGNMRIMQFVASWYRSSRSHRWQWRALLVAIACTISGSAFQALATAPVRLERDVTDVSAWLEDYKPAEETAGDDAKTRGQWHSIEIANPKKEMLHRIIIVDARDDGILQFLSQGGTRRITAVQAVGDGARIQIISIDGTRAAELFLEPLAKARFAVKVEEGTAPAPWKFWKPEALAAAKRTETLVMGLLSGALLVMVAWLSGLAVLRRSREPAWAAASLGCLLFLILGQSIAELPDQVLLGLACLMFACGLRYVIYHLSWELHRRRLATLTDGLALAIIGFGAEAAIGIGYAWPALATVLVAAPVLAGTAAVLDAMQPGSRARALLPGIIILALAALVPWLLADEISSLISNFPLFTDALVTSGMLALSFAAAAPPEPDLDEATREQLSEEGRKARESEYRYALGLAAAHQGLWDWNFETDKLFVSPSVEALLGLDTGTLASSERKWADLIMPEDIRIYADTLNAHRKQGNSSFTLEVRMRHAKGGARWVQLRASCVADSKGKAIRCIGVVSDITARKSQESQRTPDDALDSATGLMQRNEFLKQLDAILTSMKGGRARRHGAVLAIDVDRLRAVTDSMGHDAGDKFLSQIAQRLDHAVGPDDAVARLGADEFAVLALGSQGDEDGAQVAQRIRDALTQPVTVSGREIYPAASIGLALIEPGHRHSGEVLREAELAMYHAKRAGRGGFEIYQPQMKPRSPDRLTMDTDLRTALERQQIEIHFQPIVRLEDNSIAGFEALMRWRHPQRGMLSPAEFIPLAEETGLIVPLGSYAVERAAVELRRWQTNFPSREPIFCSVNVSARQLLRSEFFDDVIDILDRQQPARLSLKLELTESVIMQNPESMAEALAHLKESGAGLALDDFGTGFSSLAYLQRFPFDTVKIDRSFITDMAHNKETPVVLRSIIRLAHDLDMSVVAEGVETQVEASNLRQLQCEFAQGFLFGAPMTANAAYNLIASTSRGIPPSRGLPASRGLPPSKGLPRPGGGSGSGPARVPRKL
ncbi:MAG: EAL domain-containing protein [Micropepsaceae bacterium]